jgi:hypothetical protein
MAQQQTSHIDPCLASFKSEVALLQLRTLIIGISIAGGYCELTDQATSIGGAAVEQRPDCGRSASKLWQVRSSQLKRRPIPNAG